MSEITSEALFSADARKSAGARQLGEMLLRGIRGVGSGGGEMSKGLMQAHLRAAVGGNARDFGRVASTRDTGGYFSKARDIVDDAARLERVPRSSFRAVLEKSLERRTDELASHLGSERHKGDGFSAPAGRVRGSDTPFGSNAAREEHFREPHADPNAFHESGRVRGAGSTARQGYEYPADAAASPMQRLFGPAANARDMNWDGDDDFGHEHRYTRPARGDLNWHRDDGLTGNMRQRHMTEGRVPQYRPDRPYPGYAGDEHGRTFEELIDGKAAGIAPGESLTAFAKRLMGGSAGTSFAKSLDVAFEHRHELGEGLYRDYVAMRSNIADARRPDDWRRSDLYRDLLGRIERCAASSLIKRELVQALA